MARIDHSLNLTPMLRSEASRRRVIHEAQERACEEIRHVRGYLNATRRADAFWRATGSAPGTFSRCTSPALRRREHACSSSPVVTSGNTEGTAGPGTKTNDTRTLQAEMISVVSKIEPGQSGTPLQSALMHSINPSAATIDPPRTELDTIPNAVRPHERQPTEMAEQGLLEQQNVLRMEERPAEHLQEGAAAGGARQRDLVMQARRAAVVICAGGGAGQSREGEPSHGLERYAREERQLGQQQPNAESQAQGLASTGRIASAYAEPSPTTGGQHLDWPGHLRTTLKPTMEEAEATRTEIFSRVVSATDAISISEAPSTSDELSTSEPALTSEPISTSSLIRLSPKATADQLSSQRGSEDVLLPGNVQAAVSGAKPRAQLLRMSRSGAGNGGGATQAVGKEREAICNTSQVMGKPCQGEDRSAFDRIRLQTQHLRAFLSLPRNIDSGARDGAPATASSGTNTSPAGEFDNGKGLDEVGGEAARLHVSHPAAAVWKGHVAPVCRKLSVGALAVTPPNTWRHGALQASSKSCRTQSDASSRHRTPATVGKGDLALGVYWAAQCETTEQMLDFLVERARDRALSTCYLDEQHQLSSSDPSTGL